MNSLFRSVVCVAAMFPLWAGCNEDPPTVEIPELPPPENPKKPRQPTKPEPAPETSLPDRVAAIGAALSPLLECPTKIWDNASWQDRPMLFVSVSAKRAFLWNDQKTHERSMHEIDFAGLPEGALTPYFNLVDYEGSSTLVMSLDHTEKLNRIAVKYFDVAVTLAIHEGFHLWHQRSWTMKQDPTAGEASQRSPDYPDVYRLRYLRSRVIASLRASAYSGAPVGVAAYWQETLRAEYPRELAAMTDTDVSEGSAQYVTTVAEILGKLGCEASADAILSEVESHRDTFLARDLDFGAGREFYDTGLMAGLVLRKSGAANVGVEVENGATMLQVLLKGVAPIAEPDDAVALAAAKETIEERNAEAGLWIDPLVARLDDPAATRLTIPMMWVDGAFAMGDSFYVVGRPDRTYVLQGFSASLVEPSSKITVAPHALDVVFDVKNPCGDYMITIPLAAGVIELDPESGKASSTSAQLDMKELPMTRKVDEGGLSWLCPTGAP